MNGTQPKSPSAALSLASSAKDLIRRLSKISHEKYSFSTASCEPYNTAWVAMVTKEINGQKEWLFPECFYNLLKTQAEDGSWAYHPQSKTTGVLGTAAGLLALLKHLKKPFQIYDVSNNEIRKRIALATESLKIQLHNWDDAQSTNHIGVEIITPSLLAYLEQEDANLRFQFPAQAAIQKMYDAKMSLFKPEYLYEQKVSTAAHSLEAFIGRIDFDRVSGHVWNGSMMASPSSTAVYLMYASVWDDEAEGFLRHVVKAGSGHGDGGVPGTFPTSYFEYSWSGFSVEDLGPKEIGVIADHLEAGFKQEGGIIGFAPRAPDADDTAKGLMALNLMGRHISPDQMIKTFEGRNHFTTFGSERDPSLTSNCHVLLALLRQPNVSQYYPQIIKTANFICEYWWTSQGRIRDKWHLSYMYPTMLMVEAFGELLHHLEGNSALLETASQKLLWRARICLFQACLRTLLDQNEDGSWEGLPEQTSYAILALAEAQKCSLFNDVAVPLQTAIYRGARFLETHKVGPGEQGWTSKAAYRVEFVAEAYELAALNLAALGSKATGAGVSAAKSLTGPEFEAYIAALKRAPLFSEMPEWKLRASLFESNLFVPMLRDQNDEFETADDKYLDMIAFTWVSLNNRSNSCLSTARLYAMMLTSLQSAQAEDISQAGAAPAVPDASELCRLMEAVSKQTPHNNKSLTADLNGGGLPDINGKFETSIGRFIVHVLNLVPAVA
ncbi:hypothetical protein MCOR28_008313 [Pyricularia oryzae]|nr:hypothetical protein MCOR26_007670 [Pyricularia oryzae]KAI6337823.1 hypothetical protein MCOR28_008313 [Pyricularia oryzae]KAI6403340.1 hypothetical protein MCOR20_007342 [Pyricularia oryzae]KAI6445467.1 hypothetical protein MCOR22_004254 [Pyricularia oryzae]KAI6529963.1 hypothetical protein MCOR10_003544 [Pyricularia oryzae]